MILMSALRAQDIMDFAMGWIFAAGPPSQEGLVPSLIDLFHGTIRPSSQAQ
ncbi:hypothetical protein ACFQFQ_11215 [Sulfitobacter porphyrae]|uniref:TetR family transcriptional regulator n=1 Tax=Sulfitobacter porphyrae TaxID=1246864 RepID=A0ABW2B312_9RHOB